MAMAPRSAAEKEARAPDSFPIGVRAPATMTEPGMPCSLRGARSLGEASHGGVPWRPAVPWDVMALTEVDHVAIAVRDLDAAMAWYADAFGATVAHREVVERDGVEEALLAVADSYVQLLTPIRDDSPVAKYLATKGRACTTWATGSPTAPPPCSRRWPPEPAPSTPSPGPGRAGRRWRSCTRRPRSAR